MARRAERSARTLPSARPAGVTDCHPPAEPSRSAGPDTLHGIGIRRSHAVADFGTLQALRVCVRVGAGSRLPAAHFCGGCHVVHIGLRRRGAWLPAVVDDSRCRASGTGNAAMAIGVRQRRCRGLSGSSSCATEDSRAETLGATLSSRTWPVCSTRGAAQARVLCTPRFAAAPVLPARGFTLAAAGCS
jgi:hypothetical protein